MRQAQVLFLDSCYTAGSAMATKAGAHSQLTEVRSFVRLGRGWEQGQSHPTASELPPEDLMAVRRLLGKSVDRDSEGKAPSTGRAALLSAVADGLRVMQVAQKSAKGHLSKLRQRLALRRWLGQNFAGWRNLVITGGAARSSSLATL